MTLALLRKAECHTTLSSWTQRVTTEVFIKANTNNLLKKCSNQSIWLKSGNHFSTTTEESPTHTVEQ